MNSSTLLSIYLLCNAVFCTLHWQGNKSTLFRIPVKFCECLFRICPFVLFFHDCSGEVFPFLLAM